jgi:GT2 family glycosyltransferase
LKTSIVILTYNKLEYTVQCIESIRRFTTPGTYEIIVVDNHSTDGTVQWLKQQQDITAIFNVENLGFPKGCNQGIEIARGDNILLLNNDTVVTHRWLDNLVQALYSDDKIGAVGAVTNYCAYYQTIPVSYGGIEEMHSFAERYNESDPTKWEERLKLIGYCMLIKKSVVQEIGLLDERFTPGNFEDDDYSFRMREAGYKLLLCKDTFIHHFGSTSFKENRTSYSDLLRRNQQKFIEKWGFNSEATTVIREDLISLIRKPKDAPLNVLEVGCGSGGTLLKIKHEYPNAQLFGTEANPQAAATARFFARIAVGVIDEMPLDYPDAFFDVILIGDHLDRSEQSVELLMRLRNVLKDDGQMVVSLPNLLHYDVIRSMVRGTITDSQLRYYKLSDVQELFQKAGYEKTEISATRVQPGKEDEQFLKQLMELSKVNVTEPYEIYRFLVRAGKYGTEYEIERLLDELEQEQDAAPILTQLLHYDVEQVIGVIEAKKENKIALLNWLAVQYFHRNESDRILPFLNKAYELDPTHTDTLYNLGCVMEALGELELAMEWLRLIEEKDEEIVQLIETIKNKNLVAKWESRKLMVLLRRIENDIEKEISLESVLQLLSVGEIRSEDIIAVVDQDLVDKERVLNAIAVSCFERSLHDHVLPLLSHSLQINPDDPDTLFNLGYILYRLGEYEEAIRLLERISDPDQETREMISHMREVLHP